MMTKAELTKRKMKLKKTVEKRNKRKALMSNVVAGLVLVVGMALLGSMFAKTWDDELKAHGEYNIEYQNEMDNQAGR